MNLKKFMDILSYKRGHDSDSADAFIDKYLKPLHPEIDGGGNLHVVVGESSKTIFSTHIDTVHRTEGKQKVVYCPITNELYLDDKKDNCLGADDGAGLYLALGMIERKVPGRYIFHAGEECGGIGSMWLARNRPDMLRDYQRAVALDRGGMADIITHQGGQRCASDEFGRALANQLTRFGMVFAPSDRGVFTDTANYKTLIPECTNISVGYSQQHTNYETQNLPFLSRLERMLHWIDWEKLPIKRTIQSEVPAMSSSKRKLFSLSAKERREQVEEDYNDWVRSHNTKSAPAKIPTAKDLPPDDDDDLNSDAPPGYLDPQDFSYEDWVVICTQYPEVAAELLLGNNVSFEEFFESLEAWNVKVEELEDEVIADRESRRLRKIRVDKQKTTDLSKATAAPPQSKALPALDDSPIDTAWSVQ